jgi:hypothetical protein
MTLAILKKKPGPDLNDDLVSSAIFYLPAREPGRADASDRKVISGKDKNDKLNGTNGNDRIDGKAVTTRTGDACKDKFLDGSGFDAANLSGTRSSCQVSRDVNGQITFSKESSQIQLLSPRHMSGC